MRLSDALKVFGLTNNAVYTESELKKRYKQLIKENHPDVSKDINALSITQDIIAAYEILIKTVSRKKITKSTFKSEALSDEAISNLYASKKSHPYPIRATIISWLMRTGRVSDICEIYQTPTGVVYAIRDMDTSHISRELQKLKNLVTIESISRKGRGNSTLEKTIQIMTAELERRLPTVTAEKHIIINFGGMS